MPVQASGLSVPRALLTSHQKAACKCNCLIGLLPWQPAAAPPCLTCSVPCLGCSYLKGTGSPRFSVTRTQSRPANQTWLDPKPSKNFQRYACTRCNMSQECVGIGHTDIQTVSEAMPTCLQPAECTLHHPATPLCSNIPFSNLHSGIKIQFHEPWQWRANRFPSSNSVYRPLIHNQGIKWE